MFKHLVDIESLSKPDIETIMKFAKNFKERNCIPQANGHNIALLFAENSTRTKCSFEIAAGNLGINIINFDSAHSSLNKGESLKDTIENLYYLGVEAVVIRHGLSGIINNTMNLVKCPMSFINAGDGNHSHPTQALLDYFTMIEKLRSIEGKKVAIVGDISHSRVAKSNIVLLNKFGVDINLCSPTYFKPEQCACFNANWCKSVEEAIENADVVMVLRVQNERLSGMYPENSEYKRLYEIDSKLLREYAPNAILMHPGPANRNIEVSSELLDNKVGETILEQARNGVFVRMAVLNMILSSKEVCYAS